MWPWGHLAAGYLCYAAYSRAVVGRPPRGVLALVAALGTQLPDLVDKPLAWYLGVLPNGRSLGHSLLVAGVVLGGLWILAANRGQRRAVVAGAIGSVTHLLGDALYPALALRVGELGFLWWPVVPPLEYETGKSVSAHVLAFHLGPTQLFEVALFVTATVVWYVDGCPGLGTLLRAVPGRAGHERPTDD